MKTKLLSVIVVSMLLIGSLALAINLTPNAKAVEPPYYLTIQTSPPGLPVTVPAVGTYRYDIEHWVNCTAMLEYIDGDTKYVFDHWEVSPYSGEWSAKTGQMWVHVDQNKTATAVYKVYYKFTVIYPWSADWLVEFVPGIFKQGVGPVAGSGENGTYWAWIEKGTLVHAGLRHPSGGLWVVTGTPAIYGRHYDEVVAFVNWTGLGYWIWTDGAGNKWAVTPMNAINMTGPKTAVADWKFVYMLYVKANVSVYPWVGTPTPPPGQGWYDKGKDVTLVAPELAPDPGWVVPGYGRWIFDTWKLDGVVPPGQPNRTLVVHMDKNHTAEAFYTRQSWITLADNIGNQSGIADNGKWYYDERDYTFVAPPYVYLSGNIRYEFRFWELVPDGKYFGHGKPTITLHINYTYSGKKLIARYQTQYKLNLFSSPEGVPDEPDFLYPDSKRSGWYDAGSCVDIKALPIIPITTTSRWKFVKWQDQLGGWTSNNNHTVGMDRPKNVTAYYDLEHYIKWDVSPAGLTFPGEWGPGSAWVKNGTTIGWWAPQYDTTTYVFHHWVVNDVEYEVGRNELGPWLVTGPIIGTAYYVNKTKIFMDPSYHEETSHAYCNTFSVTVYASNFDAKRTVGGQPMDIYGFDIRIKWDPKLIELKNVNLNLADFFAPNDYFIAVNTIDNVAGTYELAATVKGNYTGFSGTKAMFTMVFHVKYDVCYPESAWTLIKFDPDQRELANHLGNAITPELGWSPNCKYVIKSVKPMLEVRDAADHDDLIKVDKNVPQTYFDAEVYLNQGVKVYGYYVKVKYDPTQIEAVSVTIKDYLKPPFTTYYWIIDKYNGIVYVEVVQDSSVPLQNCSGVLFTITFKVVKAIYYTIRGPHYLKSYIEIVDAWLFVKCPDPRYQQLGIDLGAKKATYLYNPLPGDLDFDGCVTVLDLQLIADNFHKTPVKYDITGDGETDLYDLVFVALRFGTHV
jgi:hypothetical protein